MATAYWVYGGSSQDLNDASNWWQDSGGTIPFGGVPGSGDDAVILGSTMPTSNTGVTALNSWDSSGAATGTVIGSAVTSILAASAGFTIGVSGDATSAHQWAGTLSGGTVIVQGGALWSWGNGDSAGAVTVRDSGTMETSNNTATASSVALQNSAVLNLGGGTLFITGTFTAVDSSHVQNDGPGAVLNLGGTSSMSSGTTLAHAGAFSTVAFTVQGSGTLTLSGTTIGVNGSGPYLTFGGSISVVLSGAPTFNDASTFNTSGDLTINNAIHFTGFTVTAVGGITLNNTAQLNNTVAACTSIVLGGSSQITGGTIADSGSIVLGGSSQITGGTIACTTLTLNSTAAISSGTITCSGGVTFNSSSTGTGGTVGCTTLTLNSPSAINGITINPSGSVTGTQDPGTIPSPDDVRSGVAVGSSTGNMTEPAPSDVKSGVQYGTSGTQYTGSYVAAGGTVLVQRVTNILVDR